MCMHAYIDICKWFEHLYSQNNEYAPNLVVIRLSTYDKDAHTTTTTTTSTRQHQHQYSRQKRLEPHLYDREHLFRDELNARLNGPDHLARGEFMRDRERATHRRVHTVSHAHHDHHAKKGWFEQVWYINVCVCVCVCVYVCVLFGIAGAATWSVDMTRHEILSVPISYMVAMPPLK